MKQHDKRFPRGVASAQPCRCESVQHRRHRLRRTHLNGNPGFRNAFLTRLHSLPNLWVGSDHLRRPHTASGLPPMIPRGSRALRRGRRRSSQRSSGPLSPLTKRAQQKLSRFVRTAARQQFVGPLLSLRGIPGRLHVGRAGRFRLARSLAPAQLARCLGRGEKGIPLLLGGCARLCCAEAACERDFPRRSLIHC